MEAYRSFLEIKVYQDEFKERIVQNVREISSAAGKDVIVF
jgi:hypothetical protein